MAFAFAGLIFVATLSCAALIMLSNMSQPAPMPSNQTSLFPVLIGGLIIAAAVAGSHWMHFSW